MSLCCLTCRSSGLWPLGEWRPGRFVRAGPGYPSLLSGPQQAGPTDLEAELGQDSVTRTLSPPKLQVPPLRHLHLRVAGVTTLTELCFWCLLFITDSGFSASGHFYKHFVQWGYTKNKEDKNKIKWHGVHQQSVDSLCFMPFLSALFIHVKFRVCIKSLC